MLAGMSISRRGFLVGSTLCGLPPIQGFAWCCCCGQVVKLEHGYAVRHQQTSAAIGTDYETEGGECYASGFPPHARCHCGLFVKIDAESGGLDPHHPALCADRRIWCNPERGLRQDLTLVDLDRARMREAIAAPSKS